MSLKCKLGFHTWVGCKCTQCDKIRDEQHDWSKDCEKCSICGKEQIEGVFTDFRDGKTYKTIKIGNQRIMADNFAYKPSVGNYWAYDDDESNVDRYGYLYDWETAKKIAPSGWHLPTFAEWETFFTYLGNDENKVFNAMDVGGFSGFNVLFSGIRDSNDTFCHTGVAAAFWSSTSSEVGRAWLLFCFSRNGKATPLDDKNNCGFSVRLFKD